MQLESDSREMEFQDSHMESDEASNHDDNTEQEAERFMLQLVVTEEQRAVIEALFGHFDWDYQEVGEREQHGDFEEGPEIPGFVVPQNPNATECGHCLSKPSITDPCHKQFWWEDEPQPPNERNSGTRKGLYKRFWTMLFHRLVWQDPRYLERKSTALGQDGNRIHHVWSGGRLHKRDIMPTCVLTVVRNWFPNPPKMDYMGHRWG